jgi:hypothetical protein
MLVCGEHAPPSAGSVEGRVLDHEGKPVANAKVYAEPIPRPLKMTFSPTVSDEQGRFWLQGLGAGDYRIRAHKEEAGYPRTSIPFFAIGAPPAPEVTVEENRITRVEARLGPPRGMISGRVVDAETGQPVPASVTVKSVENPDVWVSAGTDLVGQFKLPVPSVALQLEVEAEGYGMWRSEVIVVPSRTVETLLIPLVAKGNAAGKRTKE